ncbi:phospholipid phosphatase 2-like isoform X1 [Ostrinia nubilalis]|uniref:phospholipid phosphatase 2-like isoform X1 n=1 Tax=Ostrinia nubilalis TaxID=29057 RepID=UPI0030825F9E
MGALDCMSSGKMQLADSTEVFAISTSSNTTLNEPRKDVESQKEGTKRHSYWWTLLIDVPLLCVVLALIGLFELGFIPSHKAGFVCGDPSLSFPFNGDTVSTGVLIAVIFFAPIVVMFITELVFTDSDYSHKARLHQAFIKCLLVYKCYIYGLIFNFVVIEVMKGLAGSPRPTFFDLCEPDTAKTCNGNEFVTTYTCTSKRFSWWMQNDAHHSFPSGHTSLSVHCGLFIAWYVQKRAFDWRHRTVFVVPCIQFVAVSFAALASLSRITDHRHHWWDVLAGFFIGFATFFYAAVVLCKNFSRTSNKEESSPTQSSVRTLVYDSQTSVGSP